MRLDELPKSQRTKPRTPGCKAIAAMWDDARDGSDEVFTMDREVVASTATPASRGCGCATATRCPRSTPTCGWFGSSGGARGALRGVAVLAVARPRPARVAGGGARRGRRGAPGGRSGCARALSAGVYRLAAGATDTQTPHDEDEVYVVLRGAASLLVEGVPHPVREGRRLRAGAGRAPVHRHHRGPGGRGGVRAAGVRLSRRGEVPAGVRELGGVPGPRCPRGLLGWCGG